MPKHWFPLESNQDVMNAYIQKMGVDVSKIQFCEVLSMEDWALDMVPKPVGTRWVYLVRFVNL